MSTTSPSTATLIFDLDGTLIDSAPSILAGLAHALAAAGHTAAVPLTAALIGPPLRATLATLAPGADDAALDRMVAHFKQYYDSEGYKLSTPYAGVAAALAKLHAGGATLHLATNKRYAPTALILAHLSWLPWFRSVYSLDKPGHRYADKSAMVAGQMAAEHIAANATGNSWYVGDRDEDRVAAEANGLGFIGVAWGYGDFAPDAAHAVLRESLAELAPLLAAA